MYGGSAGFAQGLMLFYALLLARSLGPGLYGVYAGGYAIASISSFLINWGMDTWLLRTGANGQNPRALSGAVLRVKLVLGSVWSVVLVLLVPWVRGDLFTPVIIAVCAMDVWADSAFNTHISALNVERRVQAISRLMLLSRGGRLLGALVLIVFCRPGPLDFATGRFFFTLFGLVAAALIHRPTLLQPGIIPSATLLRRSATYGISDFLAMIYTQGDVTMMTLLGGKTQTGIYSAAAGMTNALFVIPSTGYLIAIPMLARLFESDLDRFRRSALLLIAGFTGLGLLMTVGAGIGVSWAAPILLGEKYQETRLLLILLSPLLLFKAIEAALAACLVAVNWQQRRVSAQVIASLANILLNLWVIPRYGPVGVALVYLFSEFLLMIGYSQLTWRWFRQKEGVG